MGLISATWCLIRAELRWERTAGLFLTNQTVTALTALLPEVRVIWTLSGGFKQIKFSSERDEWKREGHTQSQGRGEESYERSKHIRKGQSLKWTWNESKCVNKPVNIIAHTLSVTQPSDTEHFPPSFSQILWQARMYPSRRSHNAFQEGTVKMADETLHASMWTQSFLATLTFYDSSYGTCILNLATRGTVVDISINCLLLQSQAKF